MAIQIRTPQQFFAWIVAIARAQEANGWRTELAIRYGIAVAILNVLGQSAPALISGVRTIDQQRALREQAARTPGSRPVAVRSWHTVALAFDIALPYASLSLFSSIWRALGGRSGSYFTPFDPGHFDFPVSGVTPPSIND